MNQRKTSIIIADDHELFRDGLSTMLGKFDDIILLAEASTGELAVSLAGQHRPDIIFMDIQMPAMNGIEATRIISKNYPEIKIIALSMFDGDYQIAEMLENGAEGYILKGAGKHEILRAIRCAEKHQPYFCDTVTGRLAALSGKPGNYGNPLASKSFSQKEKQIISLVCEGFSAREIAEKLQLSMRTVEKYKEGLLEKTGSRNTAALIVFVMEHHIYSP